MERDGLIIMVDDDRFLNVAEKVTRSIRFRTLGVTSTGAIVSEASTPTDVIRETLLMTTSERQGRAIDKDNDTSMEIKKQQGYF